MGGGLSLKAVPPLGAPLLRCMINDSVGKILFRFNVSNVKNEKKLFKNCLKASNCIAGVNAFSDLCNIIVPRKYLANDIIPLSPRKYSVGYILLPDKISGQNFLRGKIPQVQFYFNSLMKFYRGARESSSVNTPLLIGTWPRVRATWTGTDDDDVADVSGPSESGFRVRVCGGGGCGCGRGDGRTSDLCAHLLLVAATRARITRCK